MSPERRGPADRYEDSQRALREYREYLRGMLQEDLEALVREGALTEALQELVRKGAFENTFDTLAREGAFRDALDTLAREGAFDEALRARIEQIDGASAGGRHGWVQRASQAVARFASVFAGRRRTRDAAFGAVGAVLMLAGLWALGPLRSADDPDAAGRSGTSEAAAVDSPTSGQSGADPAQSTPSAPEPRTPAELIALFEERYPRDPSFRELRTLLDRDGSTGIRSLVASWGTGQPFDTNRVRSAMAQYLVAEATGTTFVIDGIYDEPGCQGNCTRVRDHWIAEAEGGAPVPGLPEGEAWKEDPSELEPYEKFLVARRLWSDER